jgi:Domain of unknown function (DUF1707)
MPATDDNRYDRRRGPRDRRLRVGDRERDAVAEILRRQHVEGRLDSDEFEERLERCLAAKTYAELDQLVADFPGPEEKQDRVGWAWGWRPLPFALLPLALIAAIAFAGGHLAWVAFPLFFFFVVRPFLWRSWGRGYGRGAWACGPRYTTRTGTRA